MKWILLIAILTSVNAYSCPNLTGAYLCATEGEQGSFDVNIFQSELNGIFTYYLQYPNEVRTLVADGLEKTILEDGVVLANYTTTCKGAVLKKEISSDIVVHSFVYFQTPFKNLKIEKKSNIVGMNPPDVFCEKR